MQILRDGWFVEEFIDVLPPIVIARLRQYSACGSVGGDQAYWLLTDGGHFLGNTLDWLLPHMAARVRNGLLRILATKQDDNGAAFARLTNQLNGLDRWFRIALMKKLFEHAPIGPLASIDFMPGDNDRFEVVDADGALSIVIDKTLEFALSIDGKQEAAFRSGWRATHVVTCFAPLLMIELCSVDGEQATWVVDAWFNRTDGEDFSCPTTIEVLRVKAPPMMRRHWMQILALEEFGQTYSPLPMLKLNPNALSRLLYRVCDLVMPETIDSVLRTLEQPIVLPPVPGRAAELVLPEKHVRHAVRHSLYDAGVLAVRRGQLVWPSPVDGSDASLEAVFVPQEYTIVYQFRDRNGLRFLVASGERDCALIGLYLPLDNQFIGDQEPPNWWFKGHIPADFWVMLYDHCLRHAPIISGRRRNGPIDIVNVFMGPPLLHIGHYVWNDLTGQAALTRDVPDNVPISRIIAGQRGQAEFFGPLDRLFPLLAGKIDRSLPDINAFIVSTYSDNRVPIRFTRTYVDCSLRDLVRTHVLSTPLYKAVQQKRTQYRPGPVIIVGLRLEDRTFVDPPSFYEALLDHLAHHHPGTIVVLDGRNARPGGEPGEFIASIKDTVSTRPPLDAEHELVERLRIYATRHNLSITSTVGLPVEASMAWCYQAVMCVAPWGAGLAKYRWLANLPSVILTSRYNLVYRTDLDIYHSLSWMEDPSEVVFPDIQKVVDHNDKFGLAPPTEHNGRECFVVDMPHVCALVSDMLAKVVGINGRVKADRRGGVRDPTS